MIRCRRVSGIKSILRNWISVSRDRTTLPYLTISHAQTIGVSDLSCLEHTEQSTSVAEIVTFRNLPVSIWVKYKFIHPMQIFYMASQLYQGWLMHTFIRSRTVLEPRTVRSVIRFQDHSVLKWIWITEAS